MSGARVGAPRWRAACRTGWAWRTPSSLRSPGRTFGWSGAAARAAMAGCTRRAGGAAGRQRGGDARARPGAAGRSAGAGRSGAPAVDLAGGQAACPLPTASAFHPPATGPALATPAANPCRRGGTPPRWPSRCCWTERLCWRAAWAWRRPCCAACRRRWVARAPSSRGSARGRAAWAGTTSLGRGSARRWNCGSGPRTLRHRPRTPPQAKVMLRIRHPNVVQLVRRRRPGRPLRLGGLFRTVAATRHAALLPHPAPLPAR